MVGTRWLKGLQDIYIGPGHQGVSLGSSSDLGSDILLHGITGSNHFSGITHQPDRE
jgi:hypothetical protein